MILKRCHITNFGSLSNLDVDFKEDVNSYIKDNGEGKSTLAAFIKAMIFGMESASVADKNLKDRKHYYPFNGKNYGGNIVIEFKGKEYKIVRSFDSKSITKDEIKIFDDKNIKIKELSGQKINRNFDCGMYFLGINLNAFEKCNFIYSNDLEFKINDSIKHKLNNLVIDVENENSYSEVINSIKEDLRCSGEKTKNFGQRKKEQVQILEKENNDLVKKIDNIDNELMPELEDLYTDYEDDKKSLKGVIKTIEELDAKTLEFKDYETYSAYINDFNENETKRVELLNNYPKGMVNKEDFNSINEAIYENSKIVNDIEKNSLTDEDNSFIEQYNNMYTNKDNYPVNYDAYIELNNKNSAIIDKQNEIDDSVPNYSEEDLNALLSKFDGKEIESNSKLGDDLYSLNRIKSEKDKLNIEEEVDSTPKPTKVDSDYVANINKDRQEKQKELETLKNEHNKTSKLLKFVLIIITFGIYLFVLNKKEKEYQSEANAITQEIEKIDKQIESLFNKFEISGPDYASKFTYLNNKIASAEAEIKNREMKEKESKKLAETIKETTDSLSKYFSQFGYDTKDLGPTFIEYKEDLEKLDSLIKNKNNYLNSLKEDKEYLDKLKEDFDKQISKYNVQNMSSKEKLERMKKDIEDKQEYDKKLSQLNSLREEKVTNEESLSKLIKKYELKDFDSYQDLLSSLKSDYEELNALNKYLDSQKDIIEGFKKTHQFEENPDTSLDDINNQKENLKHQQKGLEQNIKNLNERILGVENEVQHKDEYIQKIEDNKESIEQLKHDVNIFEQTEKYINIAEEELEQKYLKPVKDKFVKYANLIKDNFGDNTTMNYDYQITKDVDGQVVSLEYLSDGEKSMTLLALRLAVIDNLYKEDKTFIILDDPFVYLDSKNFDNMKSLINDIAKEKQILYLTCHESRNIE